MSIPRQNLMAVALFAAAIIAPVASPVTSHAATQETAIVTAQDSVLKLETNKGVLIRLDRPAENIFIANPEIADVQVKSARMIYVFGKAAGETTLFAIDGKENIIYSSDIEVSQNLTRVSSAIRDLLPGTDIQAESINGLVVLSGYAENPDETDTAQRMIRQAVGEKIDIINRITITTPTQINLQVKIAEVGRGVLKELGFNWDASLFSGGTLFGIANGNPVTRTILDPITNLPITEFLTRGAGASSLFGSASSGNFDLTAVIDALETEGFLSVLAEPNLTALSGETASFLAGGEFPIPVPDEGDISLEFKEFGVGLTFTPRVLSDGKINLQVAPEVSQLSNSGAISINGISVPALTTRKASTTVELASGQSFAIAGLLQSNLTQDTRSFPILGDIPILGALFRSDKYQRQETELVIIVTPYIVEPVSAHRIALPTDGILSPSFSERMGGDMPMGDQRPINGPDRPAGQALVGGAGFRMNDQ